MSTQLKPKSRYNRARRKAIREGTWQRNQPAEPVRQHIRDLMNGPARLRLTDVAEQAGVPYGTVKSLMYRGDTVLGYVASLILAVQSADPAARPLVDSTGTRRRLQALARMQWNWVSIGDRLGVCSAAVSLWTRRDQVHEDTADKVRALYDEISGTLGPSLPVRLRAERLGWAPPLAWDEGAIDDPNAEPDLGDPDERDDDYDELTVALAIDGRLTHAQLIQHRPDLIEVVRRLARTMTDVEIAHHLHWPGSDDGPPGKTRGQNNVGQLRHRHGIPGPERFEAVYAYRSGGKRARNDKAA